MSVPRAKKPKQRLYTYKEHKEMCHDAMRIVNLVMIASMQDILGATGEEQVKVLETAAQYSKHYDNHYIKLKEIADIIYKNSNGEIDIRIKHGR